MSVPAAFRSNTMREAAKFWDASVQIESRYGHAGVMPCGQETLIVIEVKHSHERGSQHSHERRSQLSSN